MAESSVRRPGKTSRPTSSADRLCRMYSSGTLQLVFIGRGSDFFTFAVLDDPIDRAIRAIEGEGPMALAALIPALDCQSVIRPHAELAMQLSAGAVEASPITGVVGASLSA